MSAITYPGPIVRVGVACVITDDNGNVLGGIRKGSHGAGYWAFPGGHLEMGESWFECAVRETDEETNLKVNPERVVAVTEDMFDKDTKHYITIFVLCKVSKDSPDLKNMEPKKCEGWEWKTWKDLKKMPERSLFLPVVNLLKEKPNIETEIRGPGGNLVTREVTWAHGCLVLLASILISGWWISRK